MAEPILQRIGDASGLVGLLLVLVTLFTAEQARSLDAERARLGGASPSARSRILVLSIALVLVTAASFAALIPLAGNVVDTWGTKSWDPVFIVFLLVWLMLIPLGVWQIFIASRAAKLAV